MQLETGQVLQRLKPLFDENFERFGELGAAVSVWQNGKPIIDLYGGFCDARSRETVDGQHGRARLVCNERNWQRVCIARVATPED